MKMVLKTAAVYIGLVIGAGFASGREVMEYFNIISSVNPTGILAAAFLFMLTAYMIGAKASEENISTFDEYISDNKTGTGSAVWNYGISRCLLFKGHGCFRISLRLAAADFGCAHRIAASMEEKFPAQRSRRDSVLYGYDSIRICVILN